ncbi:DUF3168 domain-containing protein [Xanthobacter sp. V4C-4]|uniref:DUF3168 domain-containing protein n=1 Tax=Xanthobacter cornucopiae TaxID=3119924 RepID=UPI003729D7FF
MSVPLTSPVLSLRKAVHEALVADAPLLALLGGPRIHDVPPPDAAFPFVALGEAVVSDWSTATEAGAEHALTLHAFSRGGGRAEAFALAAAVQAALHDAPLALAGHRLANLRATTAEVVREKDGRTFHALVRFRAVTEPL